MIKIKKTIAYLFIEVKNNTVSLLSPPRDNNTITTISLQNTIINRQAMILVLVCTANFRQCT